MKHTAQLECGTLNGIVASEKWKSVLEQYAVEPTGSELEQRELLGQQLLLKRSDLRGKAAYRHALRRMVGLAPPRLAEYRNLTWLRERLFLAPRPVFAGVLMRNGVPRTQWLATEFMPDCRTLADFLRDATERDGVLLTLARETARMHALGFVHRDFYPRNLLVQGTRIAIVDAWRGGPGFGWRGPSYDLACLMLHGSDWFTRAEQARFFHSYFEARTEQDRPVAHPRRFAAAIEGQRARLLERLVRRPHERRGLATPAPEWRVPLR